MKRIVFAAIAALAASAASAVPVISTNTTLPAAAPLQAAPTTASANFRLNFLGDEFAAPSPNSRDVWEQTSLAGVGYYNSVEGGGFAEYDFGSDRTRFSMAWGSPDSYNTLRFFDDNAQVFEIFGNDLAITSTPGFVANRRFINIVVTGLTFDKVRLTSGSDAFEHAQVAAPIPLPAAGWMLLAGLGGLGALARRRNA